jgi:Phosphate-induced protein 1 conserved region
MVDFVTNVGASSWWSTVKKNYYKEDVAGGPKTFAGTPVKRGNYNGGNWDQYPGGLAYGTNVGPGVTSKIVNDMIDVYKAFPYDPNGIYYVLLGDGITETVVTGLNMCSDYCGYHASDTTVAGQKFYYATVGLPNRCNACIPVGIQNVSPNEPSADAMISVMAHELGDTVTSPDENGWMDDGFNEVADMCNVLKL